MKMKKERNVLFRENQRIVIIPLYLGMYVVDHKITYDHVNFYAIEKAVWQFGNRKMDKHPVDYGIL